jgi:hypothetical protein
MENQLCESEKTASIQGRTKSENQKRLQKAGNQAWEQKINSGKTGKRLCGDAAGCASRRPRPRVTRITQRPPPIAE